MAPSAAPRERWLAEIRGLDLDSDTHTYWFGDYQIDASITQVLSLSKSPAAIAAIEATRHLWEKRGVLVHKSLELSATVPNWTPDHFPDCWPYLDWIEPLMAHPIWDSTQVIASEFRLIAVNHHGPSIAGTCDLILETTDTHQRILLDLKTQANPKSSAYSTAAQLGGYIYMAGLHGIEIHRAATLWARPGRCVLKSTPVPECLDAWRTAHAEFLAAHQ